MPELPARPKLRPVEAFPIEEGGRRMFVMHDPAGLASGPITASPPTVFLLLLMDGTRSLDEVQAAFAEQIGQPVPRDELENLVRQLDAAHYLAGESFEEHFRSLAAAYRAAPARTIRDLSAYGIDGSGRDPDPAGRLRKTLSQVLSQEGVSVEPRRGRLTGLVAPHLDYPRGGPCYAAAYGVLAAAQRPRRIVILGTNHYGRSASVVATHKDFQTPLGTTRTDRDFLDALQARCGADLCAHEFDHAREHSVELQVLLLQHLLGADRFEMLAVLCPDPCGPTGTAPHNGEGVDLRIFAETLGALVREDATPTLLIAGADLSHVGRRFGDARDLSGAFLQEVELLDRAALVQCIGGEPEAFITTLAERDNSTRMCSAGCLYALRTALDGAEGELLRYHQAVDAAADICVTCCAAAFWEK
ncbi:MAG: AmmeMemoRadiSam system protein B [Phycisphaerae bacterium]|jgi:hypothetical protein